MVVRPQARFVGALLCIICTLLFYVRRFSFGPFSSKEKAANKSCYQKLPCFCNGRTRCTPTIAVRNRINWAKQHLSHKHYLYWQSSKSSILRAPVKMPSKLFCVARQHDLRKILPRSSIKKLFGSFSRKRTRKFFFVTFFQKATEGTGRVALCNSVSFGAFLCASGLKEKRLNPFDINIC